MAVTSKTALPQKGAHRFERIPSVRLEYLLQPEKVPRDAG
jgi:hypothetical protein